MTESKKIISHRNMFKNIPTTRRLEIVKKIKKMPNCLDKEILTLCFIHDMSAPAVAEYIKNNNICIGKQGKPLSVRRIQQICKQYFPDCFDYHTPVTPAKEHQHQQRKKHLKERIAIITERQHCELCGSANQLEVHHDVPLSKGGDNSPQNLYVLCHDCHMRIETNRKRIYGRDYYKSMDTTKKEGGREA